MPGQLFPMAYGGAAAALVFCEGFGLPVGWAGRRMGSR